LFSLDDQGSTGNLQAHVEEKPLGTKHGRNTRALLPRRARSSRVAHNGPSIHRTSPQLSRSPAALARQWGHRRHQTRRTRRRRFFNTAGPWGALRQFVSRRSTNSLDASRQPVLVFSLNPRITCMANANARSSTHGEISGRSRRRFSIPTQPTRAVNS
jgi:hypothetical protein